MQPLKTTPKDFFLYFGAMIALYWSACSLIALLFTMVDSLVADQLSYYVDPYSGGIRFAIASLIIIFPLCLVLFSVLKKDAFAHPEKFGLSLRKWLYALTLFLASAALLIDLIALLNSFLGGELTARFILKALSVLVVAGLVFAYCLLEIRVRPEAPTGVRKPFLFGTAFLVLAAIVSGFLVMGSPATLRKARLDDQRVNDLQNIQWQIVNFWQQKGRLPASLAELRSDSLSGAVLPKGNYELKVGESKSFELCATFETASTPSSATSPALYNENWSHPSGYYCFARTIDPELYPPRPKGI